MTESSSLTSIMGRVLAKEIEAQRISIVPYENEKAYVILNINRLHHGGNAVLRIEEEKKRFYFGPAPLSPEIANVIHELIVLGYQAGNRPGRSQSSQKREID